MRKPFVQATLAGLAVVALGLAAAGAAGGQALPTPRQFVDNLDMRCYEITDQPSVDQPLRLDHLNPVLINMHLPYESITLEEPQDLCVPVYKNSTPPPSNVLPFIEWLDWKCYGLGPVGSDLNVPLTLTQLNPIIASLLGPTVQVTVNYAEQLCVPVLKSTTSTPPTPPADVQALVEWLDVKCYSITAPTSEASLSLTHLNPLFSGYPAEKVTISGPVQLCVPVEKNQTPPPATVAQIVAYSDVLCYELDGEPLDQNLWLTHLNPVLLGLGLEQEFVPVGASDKLCVPVAKNGMLPPGSP
jgi:hypothetical protein